MEIENFITELKKTSADIAEKSYKIGCFVGIDAGFQMLEKTLSREEIPDPIPKELLRTFLEEYRKINEDSKQEVLKQ